MRKFLAYMVLFLMSLLFLGVMYKCYLILPMLMHIVLSIIGVFGSMMLLGWAIDVVENE